MTSKTLETPDLWQALSALTVKLQSEAPVSDIRSWTMPLHEQLSSMAFQ